MPEIMAEEMEPDEAAAQSRALAALGLLPPGIDLFGLHLRLLGEQAAGFYDPITDEMIVLSDGDLNAEKYFYSHEVIHALQDAYLDPDDLMEDMDGLNADEALAVIALYEGDAVAGSNDYLASDLPLAMALLDEAGTDFPELDQAPAAVGVTLLFPYVSGLDFVERLRGDGGWDAVNAAYGDLPASTEQILHPLKYLERDVPVELALPDPTATLGAGWRVVDDDTLGELQTSLLLAKSLTPEKGSMASPARSRFPRRRATRRRDGMATASPFGKTTRAAKRSSGALPGTRRNTRAPSAPPSPSLAKAAGTALRRGKWQRRRPHDARSGGAHLHDWSGGLLCAGARPGDRRRGPCRAARRARALPGAFAAVSSTPPASHVRWPSP